MKEFRVWDGKEYVNKSDLDDYYLGADGGVYYYNRMTESIMELEYTTPEFWTGLTDSEGVKIFDKDKLHLGIDFVGYVEMIDGSWRLISENPMHGRDVLFQDKAKHFTVIGTIHEDEK